MGITYDCLWQSPFKRKEVVNNGCGLWLLKIIIKITQKEAVKMTGGLRKVNFPVEQSNKTCNFPHSWGNVLQSAPLSLHFQRHWAKLRKCNHELSHVQGIITRADFVSPSPKHAVKKKYQASLTCSSEFSPKLSWCSNAGQPMKLQAFQSLLMQRFILWNCFWFFLSTQGYF